MSIKPDISVVMSVYNGALNLHKSIDSILLQEDVDFEFIIVNDGSTDQSKNILTEYAAEDKRVCIINQENKGLTKALIRGCAEAKGEFIARQDVGDISYPERLRKQLSCMRAESDTSLVSCGTRYSGPGGEYLYDIMKAKDKLQLLGDVAGPSSHPCTMFSRKFYELAGGYRAAFYFGQDRDLWPRLCALGRHILIPEVLYEASVTVGSISGLYRKEQVEIAMLIAECCRLRLEGLSESPALDKAKSIKPDAKRRRSRLASAQAFYFIGACLKQQGDHRARHYLNEALKAFPFHLRSWYKLLF
jgi:glycosyltransferase involved in cell wall biosynthesis